MKSLSFSAIVGHLIDSIATFDLICFERPSYIFIIWSAAGMDLEVSLSRLTLRTSGTAFNFVIIVIIRKSYIRFGAFHYACGVGLRINFGESFIVDRIRL